MRLIYEGKQYYAREYHAAVQVWHDAGKRFLDACDREYKVTAIGQWQDAAGELIFTNSSQVVSVGLRSIVMLVDGEPTKCTIVDGALSFTLGD